MTKPPLTPQAQDMLNRRLAVAVNGGRLDEVRQLLKEGANPNFRQAWDEPLVSFAAAFDTIEMVQLLIDFGADVRACDKDGLTPLENALESSQFDTAELLIKHGADLNHQMVKGETIPAFAAAIIADRVHKGDERTEFVLKHTPDLSLTFTHNKVEGQTIFDVLASYLQTANLRERPVVKILQDMLNKHTEALRIAAEEAQMKKVRTKRQNDLRKGRDGRFKL